MIPNDPSSDSFVNKQSRLSVVGEVESAVEVGLARASRLRQAVLRSAFEGML